MAEYNQGQPTTPNSKGSPSGSGQPKADPNSRPSDKPEDQERLAEEYTEDGLDQIPPHLTNNPNRNYDKPDLDKPAYS